MPEPLSAMAIAAIGGTLITGISTILGGGRKRREAFYARVRRDELTTELNILENKRQTISNPYAGIKDLSTMAKDLSSMVSNPFANLGVATQAAEIQIEEADIALANTLDTLRSTGSGAGGATALAQAALQSKKGVAASIEAQEAQNDKLRAEGESKLEMLKMQESQRIQTIGMSEAQRVQQAGVAGEQFMFSTRERRQTEQLNRKQAQITNAAQTAVAASQGADAIYSAGLSSFGQIASSVASNENFKWRQDPIPPG